MRAHTISIGLFVLSLFILGGCGGRPEPTQYVCPDGTVVTNVSLCPKVQVRTYYCGDKLCDAAETCADCPADCGACKKCEIVDIADAPLGALCEDANGKRSALPMDPFCVNEDNVTSIYAEAGRRLAVESYVCENDACVKKQIITADCGVFDNVNRTGRCIVGRVTRVPGCYGYTLGNNRLISDQELKMNP